MKFMINWEIHEDKRHAVMQKFMNMTAQDDQADTGDKVKLIGRWHDAASFSGVAICESDDAQAVMGWVLNWNAVANIDVTPVLDDAETRALGRAKFGGS